MQNVSITISLVLGFAALILLALLPVFFSVKDHTHDPTGIQIGSTICLEFGTLHYPHPMDGSDTHIDAAFCGEMVEAEEEGPRFPPLGSSTHLAQ